MTDTTSAPAAAPADPGPPPPRPAGLPTGSDRFFSWVRGLGIVRADAWLGGVCGGLAARLRIDPIIVRGIFVVAALIGFPALLVYAIAWALLPDTDGRIHLRELFHGRFDPAMVGILIVTVVSFVPVVPWLWNVMLWPLAATFGGGGYPPVLWGYDAIWASPLGAFGVILGLALVGGLIFLIVRSARADRLARAQAARQASAPPAPGASTASDSGDDAVIAGSPGDADSAGRAPAESAAMPDTRLFKPPAPQESMDASTTTLAAGSAATDFAAATATPADLAPAAEPPAPDPDAPGDAVAQWRATHEAWREQNDAWRRSQQDAERAAREQARRERHAHGAAFALEAEERRRLRRTTKPRTSFVFVLTALGAAIVTGALAVLAALGDRGAADYAAAIGLLAAALVAALAMVVAGAVRRRSGFLTAVTIVLLIAGLATAAASGPRPLAVGNVSFPTSTAPQSVTQVFGVTDITVAQLSTSENVQGGGVTVTKGAGDTYINVYPGSVLELEATIGAGSITYERYDAEGYQVSAGVIHPDGDRDGRAYWQWRVRNSDPRLDATTVQQVELDQNAGSVHVFIWEN